MAGGPAGPGRPVGPGRPGEYDAAVIGAGQAGLSAAFHLARLQIRHVVLDANTAPGGAWQHRAHSLTMADVHGVADLPDSAAPGPDPTRLARDVIPAYFAAYEQSNDLDVQHGVDVARVSDADGGRLRVEAEARTWTARTLINATGTWRRPFVPRLPGMGDFVGEQVHSRAYDGPGAYVGRTVLVVGGGASAVQTLGELAPMTPTLWATRRQPVWADTTGEFDGRAAVALVADRVRRGLPPASVVSVTGLRLRPQEQRAAELGAYARLTMPTRFVADGAIWPDGTHRAFDVILWATGFRADLAHLAPLHLRESGGGIRMDGTNAVRDPRVQLVGYGPSASTIGANRAGRSAALAVRRYLDGVDSGDLRD